MSESPAPTGFPHPSWSGVARLLSLVGRSECPPRPADGLLSTWHQASGTSLPFAEWCDPTTRGLANALCGPATIRRVDAAVVEFAQARAGAGHSAEALASDLVTLFELLGLMPPDDVVDPASRDTGSLDTGSLDPPSLDPAPLGSAPLGSAPPGSAPLDPVGLVARALAAWASEQVAVVSSASCVDPVTGLVNGGFLRARLRELHAQCESLAIAPPVTFGSLLVRLDLDSIPAAERISVRVAVGRALGLVFRAGETVAALSPTRLAAVMPAYALGRAESDVLLALAQRPELVEVPVMLDRLAFEDDADGTWAALAGTRVDA
jgi:hypothetical protein